MNKRTDFMVGFYMATQCWRVGYNRHVRTIFTVETKCWIIDSFYYYKTDSRALLTVMVALHPSIRESDRMRITEECIDITTGIFTAGFWTASSNLRYVDIDKNTISIHRLSVRCVFWSFCVWKKLRWALWRYGGRKELTSPFFFLFNLITLIATWINDIYIYNMY